MNTKWYNREMEKLRKVSLNGKKEYGKSDALQPLLWTLNNNPSVKEGVCLEFGVYKGKSTRCIAKHVPHLYGFDSFVGFPNDGRDDWQYDFNVNGKLPKVPKNVTLIDGFFEDTLPPFMNKLDGDITFMHIDCDIYSSTQTVLKNTEDRLADGCIVAFDELLHYTGFENNEYKALVECMKRKNFRIEWLCTLDKVLDWNTYTKVRKTYKNMGQYRRHKYHSRVVIRLWRK